MNYPPEGRALKQAIAAVDAVLFVTPEYNRDIPGALKNAIDWASRPYGQNSFARKPSAVIGTSPGAIGTAIAEQNLRSILSFCNSPQMNAPEAYIQFKPGLVTDAGELTDETTESNSCARTWRNSPDSLPAFSPSYRDGCDPRPGPRAKHHSQLPPTLSAASRTRTSVTAASSP
jgi:hypothetical protein